MALNIDYFQKLLEEERVRLEKDLATVGRRNPDAPEDWESAKPEMNIDPASQDEVADVEEEFQNNAGVEASLEERLRDVESALSLIKKGGYGICPNGNHPIDEARLRANPAAKTCVEHAN